LRITLETIVFDGGLLNYGAKFIVRGGAYETMEGNARERNVVVEYKDHATALSNCMSALGQKATWKNAESAEGRASKVPFGRIVI